MVVYLRAVLMVRLRDSRFLDKHTAIDAILGISLGSVVSLAITVGARKLDRF